MLLWVDGPSEGGVGLDRRRGPGLDRRLAPQRALLRRRRDWALRGEAEGLCACVPSSVHVRKSCLPTTQKWLDVFEGDFKLRLKEYSLD